MGWASCPSSICNLNVEQLTTLFFGSILIVSCSNGNSTSQENKVNQANTTTATQVNSDSISVNQVKVDNNKNSKKPSNLASTEKISIKNDNPISGTIKNMQNGDLKC